MEEVPVPLRGQIEQYDRAFGTMNPLEAARARMRIILEMHELYITTTNAMVLESEILKVRSWRGLLTRLDHNLMPLIVELQHGLETNLYDSITKAMQDHMTRVNVRMPKLKDVQHAVVAWENALARLRRLQLTIPRQFGDAYVHACSLREHLQHVAAEEYRITQQALLKKAREKHEKKKKH